MNAFWQYVHSTEFYRNLVQLEHQRHENAGYIVCKGILFDRSDAVGEPYETAQAIYSAVEALAAQPIEIAVTSDGMSDAVAMVTAAYGLPDAMASHAVMWLMAWIIRHNRGEE